MNNKLITILTILIYFGLLGWFLYIPLSNPGMTSAQILINYWKQYLTGVVIIFIVIYIKFIIP